MCSPYIYASPADFGEVVATHHKLKITKAVCRSTPTTSTNPYLVPRTQHRRYCTATIKSITLLRFLKFRSFIHHAPKSATFHPPNPSRSKLLYLVRSEYSKLLAYPLKRPRGGNNPESADCGLAVDALQLGKRRKKCVSCVAR